MQNNPLSLIVSGQAELTWAFTYRPKLAGNWTPDMQGLSRYVEVRGRDHIPVNAVTHGNILWIFSLDWETNVLQLSQTAVLCLSISVMDRHHSLE